MKVSYLFTFIPLLFSYIANSQQARETHVHIMCGTTHTELKICKNGQHYTTYPSLKKKCGCVASLTLASQAVRSALFKGPNLQLR